MPRADDRPRSEYVGASDAGTVVGLNQWETRFDLWGRKTGRLGEKEQTPAMEAGTVLEPIVRERLRLRDDVHRIWEPAPGEFYLHENGLVGAHPDGKIEMEHPTLDLPGEGLLEIKNVGREMFDIIVDQGLPASNICQIQQGMGVQDLPWGAFAIHGREQWQTLLFPMTRDQTLIDYLIAEGSTFMTEHVLADVAPELFPPTGVPDIPPLGGDLVHVLNDEEWDTLMDEYGIYRETSSLMKEVWEDQKGPEDEDGEATVVQGLKSRIRTKMLALGTEKAVGAGWKMLWYPEKTQKSFERKLLTEMGPFIPEDTLEVLNEILKGPEVEAIYDELCRRCRLGADDPRLKREVSRPYGPQGFAQKEG